MKKLIQAALFMLVLCLPAIGLCASSIMKVEGCEEWVSLRAQPSTSAERMKKVPLYATVTDGYDVGNGFVYCQYAGTAGFILAEYLDLATW